MLRTLRLFALAWFQTLVSRMKHGPKRPSWSFMFEWTIRFLRNDWDDSADWPLIRLRAEADARPYPKSFAKKVRLEPGELGGVPVTRFVPPDARPGVAVLFFHGGSYVYGSSKTSHAELIARLAFASGVETVGVDYRLVPEHTYPAQLEDALAAFDALVAAGTPPGSIVVAGDSAGGNLAIELQLALRDRGSAQAGAAVLISPWSDLTMPGASFTENDRFDFGDRAVLVTQAKAFVGSVPLDDPRVSPTYAELKGLAPTLVTVGEAEIPRDDILTLASRLKDAGVDVTVHVAKDMPHNAPVFAAYHPEALKAFEAIVAFVKQRLA
jgi:acetyl esterase/lipase